MLKVKGKIFQVGSGFYFEVVCLEGRYELLPDPQPCIYISRTLNHIFLGIDFIFPFMLFYISSYIINFTYKPENYNANQGNDYFTKSAFCLILKIFDLLHSQRTIYVFF